jgi:SAM-dependent methyltransferase
MAIDAADLPLIFGEAKRRAFSGSVLTLGRQDVTLTPATLCRVAEQCAYALARPPPATILPDERLDDVALLRALGFDRVDSMDVDGYEGATVIHDLNLGAPPPGLEGRYDLVFDRGTSEHVFHLPNLLSTIVRLVKPGGRIMHLVPSSNHVDHGFYMFSPTLFHDYYRANGLAVEQLRLVRHPFLRHDPVVEIYDYEPGALAPIAHGGLDEGSYQIFCVATRLAGAHHDRIPQQSFYLAAWEAGGTASGGIDRDGAVKHAAKAALRRVPPLYRALSAVSSRWKKRRLLHGALIPAERYRIEN